MGDQNSGWGCLATKIAGWVVMALVSWQPLSASPSRWNSMVLFAVSYCLNHFPWAKIRMFCVRAWGFFFSQRGLRVRLLICIQQKPAVANLSRNSTIEGLLPEPTGKSSWEAILAREPQLKAWRRKSLETTLLSPLSMRWHSSSPWWWVPTWVLLPCCPEMATRMILRDPASLHC